MPGSRGPTRFWDALAARTAPPDRANCGQERWGWKGCNTTGGGMTSCEYALGGHEICVDPDGNEIVDC